jgi:flagellar protein FlaF
MSLQAYQQAATRAENPRDLEYRLFAQVTRALIEAAKLDPITDIGRRADALDWNRRMWSTLGAVCAEPDNQLPPQLRASFISLAIWVSKYTTTVIRNQDEIEPLIDVNRMIMQGLSSGKSQAAA